MVPTNKRQISKQDVSQICIQMLEGFLDDYQVHEIHVPLHVFLDLKNRIFFADNNLTHETADLYLKKCSFSA